MDFKLGKMNIDDFEDIIKEKAKQQLQNSTRNERYKRFKTFLLFGLLVICFSGYFRLLFLLLMIFMMICLLAPDDSVLNPRKF